MSIEKVKKAKKESVALDYSKLPDHIWEKQLKEFKDSMENLAISIRQSVIKLRMIRWEMGDRDCRVEVPEAMRGKASQFGMEVNLHGHRGRRLANRVYPNTFLFFSDKEKNSYHFIKEDWLKYD